MIHERLKIGGTLREIVANMGWLLALRVLRTLFALFVMVWIARYLGAGRFGVLQYALAFVGLFSPLAILGLQQILVRDIVSHPDERDEILGTAFFLRLAGGALCMLVVLAAISIVRSDDPQAKAATAIFSLTLLLHSFDAIDLYFQSQVRSKYSVIARTAGLVLANLLRIAAILTGAGVLAFVWIGVIDIVAGAGGLVVMYRRLGLRLRRWRFSMRRARELLGQSWTLILSGALAVIYFKIDQVMLGEMAGDIEVGIYSTAVRISEVWYFLPSAVTVSVLPALVRSRSRGMELYGLRLQQLCDILALMAYAVAVPMTFVARPLMLLLYGDEFAGAGSILALHIWAGLFVFLKTALHQWLLIENRLPFLFITNGLGAAMNVVLNLVLIPRYGGMGAAFATVVSYAFASHVAILFYRASWGMGWMMTKALAAPIRVPLDLARRGGGAA